MAINTKMCCLLTGPRCNVVCLVLTAIFNSYGDRQNFNPPPQNRHPWTDRQKTRHSWLRPREDPLYRIWYKYTHWGFWANGWDITKIIFYLFIPFFSDSPTGQTCWWIFTRDSSKDVKSCKDVLFGDLIAVPPHYGGKPPPQKKTLGAWVGLSSLNDKNSNPYNLKTI